MRCPECNYLVTKVVLSRKMHTSLDNLRRRVCTECGHRWYTVQGAEKVISSYSIAWKKEGKVSVVDYAA